MQARRPAVQRCTTFPDDAVQAKRPAHQRCTDIPDGCNATSPEIRARHSLTLAARGRS